MVAWMINMLLAMGKGLRANRNVWWFNLDVRIKYNTLERLDAAMGTGNDLYLRTLAI